MTWRLDEVPAINGNCVTSLSNPQAHVRERWSSIVRHLYGKSTLFLFARGQEAAVRRADRHVPSLYMTAGVISFLCARAFMGIKCPSLAMAACTVRHSLLAWVFRARRTSGTKAVISGCTWSAAAFLHVSVIVVVAWRTKTDQSRIFHSKPSQVCKVGQQ